MLIYRYEDGLGIGPYHRDEAGGKKFSFDGSHNDKLHPTPYTDTIKDGSTRWISEFAEDCDMLDSDNVKFGFESIEQAHNWFTENERIEMYDGGVTLKKYEVPEEHISFFGHQVMFNSEIAKLVA